MLKIKNKLKRFCNTCFLLLSHQSGNFLTRQMYVSIKLLCRWYTTIEPVIFIFNTSVDDIAFHVLPSQTYVYGNETKTQQTLGPGRWTFIEFFRVDATGRTRAPVKGHQMNFTPTSRKSFNEISTFIIHGSLSRQTRPVVMRARAPSLQTDRRSVTIQ